MTITINLPDSIEKNLYQEAKKQNISIDTLITESLISIFSRQLTEEKDDFFDLTPEEVVAEIKATPPNPANIHPATESLIDLLRESPEDPDFDLDHWNRCWAEIEVVIEADEPLPTGY